MDSTTQDMTKEELVMRLSSQDEEIGRLKSDLAATKSTLAILMQQYTQVMDAMQQQEKLAGDQKRRTYREAAKAKRGTKRTDQSFPRGSHNFTDLTGRRFGMLTAIRPTEKRSYKGSVMWLCRCDCGREVEYPQDGLVYGSYKSCGCNRYSGVKAALDSLTFVDGTCIEWLENREIRSDNTSGHTGVCRTKRGKWYSLIGMQGDRYHLGLYDTFEEAVQARECAKMILHDTFTQQYREWQEKADADPEWAVKNPFRSRRYGHEELRQMVRMIMYKMQ